MKKQLLLLLVGAFGCLFTAVNPLFAQTWTLTSAPANNWSSVASSADGSKLVATVNGGGIYTSTDSGTTWTPTSADNANWAGVASSADGAILAAVIGRPQGGSVYVSRDSGATWNNRSILPPLPANTFGFAACLSADGTKLAVVENFLNTLVHEYTYGLIFTSADTGTTWNSGYLSPAGANKSFWSAVACSADGNKLVATACVWTLTTNNCWIYTSTDAGATWTSPSKLTGRVTSIASSADGIKLVL